MSNVVWIGSARISRPTMTTANGDKPVPEPGFEFKLERMFADAPAMPDADLFTLQVLDRLNRGWTARRLLIGAMGAAGGLVAAVQLLGAGAFGHLEALGGRANDFVVQQLARGGPVLTGLGVDAQAIWMSAVLALVAAGFGLARLVREI